MAKAQHAPVAQLDRASVFGTDDANPQPPCNAKTSDDCPGGACQNLCQNLAEIDQELAAVVDAWPRLSAPVKAGILAMVESAAGGTGGG